MPEESVQEQLRREFSKQIEPQGWRIVHLQELPLTAHHSWLLMQPQKKNEVYAIYVLALRHDQTPTFLNWCKIYVFKDGRACPLEWWGEWNDNYLFSGPT